MRALPVFALLLAMGTATGATRDDARADFERGVSMLRENVPAKDAQATALILRAAEAGHPRAEALVANIYLTGGPRIGIEPDPAKALLWMQRAAEHGQKDAQLALGMQYVDGPLVAPDARLAEKWLTRAAAQGDALLHASLGDMFEKGDGVEQSAEKAFRWYVEGASLGSGFAQLRVASMFLEGRGIGRDVAEAYLFAVLALRSGEPSAAELIERAARELDPATRLRMDEHASQWQAREPMPGANEPLLPEG